MKRKVRTLKRRVKTAIAKITGKYEYKQPFVGYVSSVYTGVNYRSIEAQIDHIAYLFCVTRSTAIRMYWKKGVRA